jgi:hypothetical protein
MVCLIPAQQELWPLSNHQISDILVHFVDGAHLPVACSKKISWSKPNIRHTQHMTHISKPLFNNINNVISMTTVVWVMTMHSPVGGYWFRGASHLNLQHDGDQQRQHILLNMCNLFA